MNLFARRSGPVQIEGRGSWRRIGEALSAAQDGDVIRIQPGDYVEALVIGKDVTLQASAPGVRIVGVADHCTIRVEGNVRIDGVEIVLAGPTSRAQALAHAAGNLQLESCVIRSTCAGVIAWGAGTRLQMHNCRVIETGDNGVVVGDGADCWCEATEVSHASGKGIAVLGAGTTATIRRCLITETLSFGVQVVDGASVTAVANAIRDCQASGMVCRDLESRVRFEENRIVNCAAHGVEVGHCPNAIVTGNQIDRPRFAGVSVYGEGADATIASNTITRAGGHGIQVIQGASAIVRDNIVSDSVAAGVVVGEPGTRAWIEGNQLTGVAAGVEVVNQGWADILKNTVESKGHCIYVRGPDSFARMVSNKLSGPVPDEIPADGPGATSIVGAGDIAVVFVHREGTAVVQDNELVGGKLPVAWVTGAFVETAGNFQRFGDVLRHAGTTEFFREDTFE